MILWIRRDDTVKLYTRKKRILCVLLLFSAVFAGTIGAAETEPFLKEISPGLGVNTGGYTRTPSDPILSKPVIPVSGMFSADFRFLPFLSVGLKAAGGTNGSNTDMINHAEAHALARWYFLQKPDFLKGMSLFAQLEGGMSIFWEEVGYPRSNHLPWALVPEPSFALGAGARFNLPIDNLFVEPYVRGGYPIIWGISAIVGYTFKLPPPAPKPVRTPTPARVRPQPVVTPPPAKEEPPAEDVYTPEPARTIEPPVEDAPSLDVELAELERGFGAIYFFDNRKDLSGLDAGKVEVNNVTFDRLVEFLTRYPDYKVKIEGYANAAQTEPKAAEAEDRIYLKPISLGRAETVLGVLVARGIDSERLAAVGLGGAKPVAAITDKDNLWKNRRVEFTLSK
jgi:outer membrane protein OmpA-like peptidoglycan-associated protein